MEVGCVIFYMMHKKNTRDNGLQGWNNVACWGDFKPLYSWEIYGSNILSTWCLSGSHDAHSLMLATGTDKFMVRCQRTSAALFRLLHMQNGW
jgi:hypothetical protein